ncbi:hypothetical protein M9980_13405 [Sphingomonas donggukensis]|uniref:Uncharacterized protein n=1 Tax=Sphingomonas donggukensis TaxID=2949093 RepID=A0ABY4TYX3_9SPHN|nr:hypothetical protein [Sphingomonas donggukensis]URW75508.1 hypothetical protein M9980_13405 [Sphingomonas donggukensis]
MKLPLAPITAVAAGLMVAAACLLIPADVLEAMVSASGIPALLPAAAPPLGLTARIALAVTAGAGFGALAWCGAYVILGGEGVVTLRVPRRAAPFAVPKFALPSLRGSDAHPDAPPRAPLMAARDLGVPFLEVKAKPAPPVEADLPRDLDTPLAAFDPAAIPECPAAPVPVPAPLARPRPAAIQQAGERFESFDLPRPVPSIARGTPRPIAAPQTDATIHALLDRLERGIGRRAAPTEVDAETAAIIHRVDGTLAELRRMAAR